MIREEERKKERKDGYKQQERHYLQRNLPDNNGDHQSLPDWVTVVKNQILETLSTKTENWWKEFRGQLGRVTRNKPTTTGTDNLSFQVKLAVNDIDEVVKRFLIAAEEKERDLAFKKVIKTTFSIFSDPDQCFILLLILVFDSFL